MADTAEQWLRNQALHENAAIDVRSSTGQHFVALDHVRACAAFLVFNWHFLHSNDGFPVSFSGAPVIFPLALLDEGNTGVSLFMVLSGYLFTKLLDGKRFSYRAFLWNRLIRLAPLLCVVFLVVAAKGFVAGNDPIEFLRSLPHGLIFPTWPNGGWSIATELHFYLILPALLLLARKSPGLPLAIVAAALVFRVFLYREYGQVQSLAYWTIIGRIDQFVLGVVACLYARQIAAHRRLCGAVWLAFLLFWWWFDVTGGFYQRPTYPSSSALWIVLPTIEGIAYATFIAWYDTRPVGTSGVFSRVLQRIGEYSYSIYLLHFFVVFHVASFIHHHIMELTNFYVALCWALPTFVLMMVPGYVSFRFIEAPFLRLRIGYVLPEPAESAKGTPDAAKSLA